MKKTTVIIVLVAAALAAFVYFYDLKHTKPGSTLGRFRRGCLHSYRRHHEARVHVCAI